MRLKIFFVIFCFSSSIFANENFGLPDKIEIIEEAEGLPNPFLAIGGQNNFADKDAITKAIEESITGFVESPFEGKTLLFFGKKQLRPGDSMDLFAGAKESTRILFTGIKAQRAAFEMPDGEIVEIQLVLASGVIKEEVLSIGHFISSDGWMLAIGGKLDGLQKTALKVYVDGIEFPCQVLKVDKESALSVIKVHALAGVKFPALKLSEEIPEGSALFAQEKNDQSVLKRLFVDNGMPCPAVNGELGAVILNEDKKVAFFKTQNGWISSVQLIGKLKDFGDFTTGNTCTKALRPISVFKNE